VIDSLAFMKKYREAVEKSAASRAMRWTI